MPDMSFLDAWPSTYVTLFRDLGPEVTHYYEISNFGPFDVGNVIVSLNIYMLQVLTIQFVGKHQLASAER